MKRYFSYVILLLKITRAQDGARSYDAAGCPDREAERKVCGAVRLCPQCLLTVSTPLNLLIVEGHCLLSRSVSQEELPLLSLSQQTCFKPPARKNRPQRTGYLCEFPNRSHSLHPWAHWGSAWFQRKKNYNNPWLKPKRCQAAGFNRFVPWNGHLCCGQCASFTGNISSSSLWPKCKSSSHGSKHEQPHLE